MPAPRKYATPAERQAAYRQRTIEARRQEQMVKRLPPLPAIPSLPGNARWRQMSHAAESMLQALYDEMRDYYDDRSETWQESEKGEGFLERMQGVEEVLEMTHELWS